MKKFLLLLFAISVVGADNAHAAITIKKAAPVATKQASVQDNAGSLIGSVLGFVSNVRALSAKQKDLEGDCVPTSTEINWVNDMVKEWAKTGAATETEVQRMLGMKPCASASGGYEASLRVSAGTDTSDAICYDWFGSDSDKNMVWYKFPKATKTYYCTDGQLSGCSQKNRKEVSNIYDIFNLVDFSEADYTPAEATMAAKLIAKIEQCSYAKLNAKKKAMWGEFLTTTMGGVGQSTNTATIMDAVSNVNANGGGLGGGLQSLGSIATQFMAN